MLGRRFGKLEVVNDLGVIKGHKRYECRCDCGTIISNILKYNLVRGNTNSCGCSRRKVFLDGKKFGRLTIIKKTNKQSKYVYYECLCDCGSVVIVRSDGVQKGTTTSCGCYQRQRVTTHHMSYTQTYASWSNMKRRCYNKALKAYPCYGGRGVKVCERWLESFENFYVDMGDPPTDKHSIDRIDNDGDYTPENCRWATWEEQENNKSSNVFLTYNNETKTIAEWCKKLNMSSSTLHNRLRRWPIEKALATPIKSPKLLEYNGKLDTIENLSIQFGMHVSTLRKRLKKGWNVELALTTPTSNK